MSLERLFNISYRRNVDNNPVQQLKKYLARLGILTDPAVVKKRPDRGKDYLYTLNQERILYLKDMNNTRNNITVSEQWHNERNNTTKNRLFPEWNPDEFTNFNDFIYDEIQKQILEEEADD